MKTPSIVTRIVEAVRRQARRESLNRQRIERRLEHYYTPSERTLGKDAKDAREMTRQQFTVWG
jgi:hypothetical protein